MKELEIIGFRKSLKNENSKWDFTEEVQEAEINGFKIRCDLSIEKNNAIEFEVLNAHREIDKTEFKRLANIFADYNCYFKFETIAKGYTVNQIKVLNFESLKIDLEQFTMLLKQEGFKAIR